VSSKLGYGSFDLFNIHAIALASGWRASLTMVLLSDRFLPDRGAQ